MARHKTSKPGAAFEEAEVLRPAVVVDAKLLHRIALNVRQHIQASVLPGILELMRKEAERGQMEALIIPEVKGLNMVTCCEALQPELQRRGLRTKIVDHEIPRLGMTETKTALVVSWRELA